MNRRSPPEADVRLRGFSRRDTVEAALGWIDQHALPLPAEAAPLAEAAGRVLAAEVVAPRDVPSFDRAMMDGLAVRSADSWSASTYDPREVRIIGRALPGAPYPHAVAEGEAIWIMTGAPMPQGADAVAPAETVAREPVDPSRAQLTTPLPTGKHVGRRGEDLAAEQVVLPRGRRLRPQDIGLLASLGLSEVSVVRRPRALLIITGNELLAAGAAARPYHIHDANGPMLAALATRDGALVEPAKLVDDTPERIEAALGGEADVVLVSGGSSVGEEDHAPRILAQMGELAFHGLAMRPSSPTGMGRLDQRFVFLLPGNPVSCLCAYDFFAGRLLRLLGGRTPDWPYRRVRRVLASKLVSQVGRVDYVRMTVDDRHATPLAVGGASVLSSTTRADGFTIAPHDLEGYPAGAEVDVFLYDPSG